MSDELPLRIMVHDVWNEVDLEALPSASADDVKRRALRASRVGRDPDGYVLKFRGAELADDASLAHAGVVANAALIVLPRRRRPIK